MDIVTSTENDGIYNWTIPSDFLDTYGLEYEEEGYKIKVINNGGGGTYFDYDISNQKFTIKAPTINAVFSDDTYMYTVCDELSIDIEYSHRELDVDLNICQDDICTIIAEDILDNTGEQNITWTIPSDTLIGDYEIKFIDNTNSEELDIDNSNISILPKIVVLTPNDDTVVHKNETFTINWTIAGTFPDGITPEFDLYLDNKENLAKIIDEDVTGTSYNWYIPTVVMNGYIKVQLSNYKDIYNVMYPKYVSSYSDRTMYVYEGTGSSHIESIFNGDGYDELTDNVKSAIKYVAEYDFYEGYIDKAIDYPDNDDHYPMVDENDYQTDRLDGLKNIGWSDPSLIDGGLQFTNTVTGNSIIYNADSDYDMEIIITLADDDIEYHLTRDGNIALCFLICEIK